MKLYLKMCKYENYKQRKCFPPHSDRAWMSGETPGFFISILIRKKCQGHTWSSFKEQKV